MTVEDHCVYVKWIKNKFIILSLYGDNIMLVRNDMELIATTQKWLSSTFEMKELGEANYVLRDKISRYRSKRLLSLSQETYIKRILVWFGMHYSKPINTPIEKGQNLRTKQSSKTKEKKR